MKLISVIMPVYNVAEYVEASIISVLKQNFDNFELLIIDDGSTDGSENICDRYAAKDNRIRLWHTENQGVSAARNIGLDNAHGEYICFIDSDDTYTDDTLEKFYSVITGYGGDIAIGALREIDGNGNLKKIETFTDLKNEDYTEEEFWNRHAEKGIIAGTIVMTKIYRKEIWDGIRFPVGKVYEDEAVLHKLIGRASKITAFNDIIYNYMLRIGSIVHSGFSYKNLAASQFYADRLEYFIEKGFYEPCEWTFRDGAAILASTYKMYDHVEKNMEELNDLYSRYKVIIRKMNGHFKSIKMFMKMAVFCISIDLYRKISIDMGLNAKDKNTDEVV